MLSFGVLAGYAGSQADKLFDVERRHRKLALELEAIGPYLAPLPQDEQDRFRLTVGDRSFGREDPTLGARGDKSPATLLDLISSKEGQQLLKLLSDIYEKSVRVDKK